ncbi:unnamed protein product [Paramecium sonneborni]|uniref:Uncharacterized protein n=1 Tax=Paramecium sonneborni TaxID=65129 RepID=A0A8S1QSF5_9CILI|nr:unnamed protein product [Paramecium sonneborni]
MGSTQNCFKQQNLNSNEFQIPVIVKQQLIQHHPTKQNYLIEPLYYLGEKSESLEQLEFILQQSNANISLNQTATFCSNSNQRCFQLEKQPNSITLLPSQQEQQQKQKINQKDNQQQIQYPNLLLKQHKQNSEREVKMISQSQKKKSISRSLSNFKQQKMEQKEYQVKRQIEQDCNTIKSILKNKLFVENQKQIKYKRGQSLIQKSNLVEIYDNQSQNTSKIQKKKVKFDPKILRQKNEHFFQ